MAAKKRHNAAVTGLCLAGKHGLDHPSQPCDLCACGQLAAAITPKTQAEAWALHAAARCFVATMTAHNYAISAADLDYLTTLRAMLARSEGLE